MIVHQKYPPPPELHFYCSCHVLYVLKEAWLCSCLRTDHYLFDGGGGGGWKIFTCKSFLYIRGSCFNQFFCVSSSSFQHFFSVAYRPKSHSHGTNKTGMLEGKRSIGEKKNKGNYQFRRCLSCPRALPSSMMVLYQP